MEFKAEDKVVMDRTGVGYRTIKAEENIRIISESNLYLTEW